MWPDGVARPLLPDNVIELMDHQEKFFCLIRNNIDGIEPVLVSDWQGS